MNIVNQKINSSLNFCGVKQPKNSAKIMDELGFNPLYDPMRARITMEQDALRTFSSGIKDIFSFKFLKNIFKK